MAAMRSILPRPSLMVPDLGGFNPAKIPGCVLWLPTDQNNGVPAAGMASQFTIANSEFLSVANNATLQTGDIDFEISLSVYKDASAAAYQIVASKWASGQFEWILQWNYNTNRFEFYVSNNGAALSTPAVANSLGAVANATWYDIKVGHNATLNIIYIQVNGGPVDSVAHTTGVFAGTSALRIGTDGTTASFWGGRIQDVRFSKNGVPVSYWPLNEPAGTRFDQIGTNHLTDNNTVTTNPGNPAVLNAVSGLQDLGPFKHVATASPQANRPTVRQSPAGRDVMEYDGVNDYLEFPDHPSLRLVTGGYFGIWVRPTSFAAYPRLISKSNPFQYQLLLYADARISLATPTPVLSTTNPPVLNVWQFIEADFNASEYRLFINLKLSGSGASPGLPADTAGILRIGSASSAVGELVTGQIGDVFIADRPLGIGERRRLAQKSAWKYGVTL